MKQAKSPAEWHKTMLLVGLSVTSGLIVLLLSGSVAGISLGPVGDTISSVTSVSGERMIQHDTIQVTEIPILQSMTGWSNFGRKPSPTKNTNAFLPGKWRERRDMPTPRAGLATCAVNGRIYSIGGSGRGVDVGSTVEAYNPQRNKWQRRAKMPTPKLGVPASVVDRKIYVIGGSVLQGRMAAPSSTVEVYDPALDIWEKKAATPTLRFHQATSVVDGKIYAIGGKTGLPRWEMVATVEAYDPSTDTWLKRKDMPTPRTCATSAVNGKIYAIGGLNGDGDLSTVEIYDPRIDQWTKGASMPTPRHGLSTNVIDGKIYAIGGGNWEGDEYVVLPIIEIYDPSANKWTKGPDIPSDWVSFSTVVFSGRIYVIGGSEVGSIFRNGRVWTFFSVGDFGKMLEFDTGFRSVEAFGKKPTLWGMLKAASN